MLSAERRVSGSTGVHAALVAPSGAVRAAGSTRRRQYAPQAVRAAGRTHRRPYISSRETYRFAKNIKKVSAEAQNSMSKMPECL